MLDFSDPGAECARLPAMCGPTASSLYAFVCSLGVKANYQPERLHPSLGGTIHIPIAKLLLSATDLQTPWLAEEYAAIADAFERDFVVLRKGPNNDRTFSIYAAARNGQRAWTDGHLHCHEAKGAGLFYPANAGTSPVWRCRQAPLEIVDGPPDPVYTQWRFLLQQQQGPFQALDERF